MYISVCIHKYKYSKSNTHTKFEKCKHKDLSTENPNIDDVDKIFYSYFIEHNKKNGYYLIKCRFHIVFNDNQYCSYVTSNFIDNKRMISWSNFL